MPIPYIFRGGASQPKNTASPSTDDGQTFVQKAGDSSSSLLIIFAIYKRRHQVGGRERRRRTSLVMILVLRIRLLSLSVDPPPRRLAGARGLTWETTNEYNSKFILEYNYPNTSIDLAIATVVRHGLHSQ